MGDDMGDGMMEDHMGDDMGDGMMEDHMDADDMGDDGAGDGAAQ